MLICDASLYPSHFNAYPDMLGYHTGPQVLLYITDSGVGRSCSTICRYDISHGCIFSLRQRMPCQSSRIYANLLGLVTWNLSFSDTTAAGHVSCAHYIIVATSLNIRPDSYTVLMSSSLIYGLVDLSDHKSLVVVSPHTPQAYGRKLPKRYGVV